MFNFSIKYIKLGNIEKVYKKGVLAVGFMDAIEKVRKGNKNIEIIKVELGRV